MEVVKEYQGNENKEISRMPFLMLGLDLPPPPLFKDVMEKNIIPQVYTPLALDFVVMASLDFVVMAILFHLRNAFQKREHYDELDM